MDGGSMAGALYYSDIISVCSTGTTRTIFGEFEARPDLPIVVFYSYLFISLGTIYLT